MLELETALERILQQISPLPSQTLPLSQAQNRFLAHPIAARMDLPHFDNSAMDGFAVRAEDLREIPVALKLQGRVAAGEFFPGKMEPGSCIRLFTGSPLPDGADAVIMQEDTRLDPAQPEFVQMLDRVKPWENVRLRGEDVKRGAPLIEAGERLTATRCALLAATGVDVVSVGAMPQVGVLATGSELVEPGDRLAPGQIYESNRLLIGSLLRSIAGGAAVCSSIVRDTLDETRQALEHAFEHGHAVITCGGVSVGEFDFVKSAFEAMGGQLDFWKVAIRPGKPFVFGQWRGKYLFGLPGNPVSAAVTFVLLVRPALLRMQGARDLSPRMTLGTLAEPLVNRGDRRHFMRVTLDSHGHVKSAGAQASHMLNSLAQANGLVDVPPATTWPAGASIRVITLD